MDSAISQFFPCQYLSFLISPSHYTLPSSSCLFSVLISFFLLSDIRERDLVELVLEVSVSQVSHRQRDMLLRQVGVLLGVLDSDIIVREISAFNEHRWVFLCRFLIYWCLALFLVFKYCNTTYIVSLTFTAFLKTSTFDWLVDITLHWNLSFFPLYSALVWSSWCQVVQDAPLCLATVLHLVYATNCENRRMTFWFTRLGEWIQSVSTWQNRSTGQCKETKLLSPRL